MKPILEVQNLSKRFRIRHLAGGYLSLRERVFEVFKRTPSEDFWALNDVSFAVQPGESLGIIGRNGAGKSTLLKILSKITPPTKGRIITRGRIASLLEVGTGFHPELTGRENIFFNGSLLGMKRSEIQTKFDEIVDFSGTEKFLDTQLKHYSSGMQLRLAFSVAAFLEPEILVIDEVLAVGDAEFQKKCLGKMDDVSKSGRTILFVSHNMVAVENLCRKGVLLADGQVKAYGSAQEVIGLYQRQVTSEVSETYHRKKTPRSEMFFETLKAELTGSQPAHKLVVTASVRSSRIHPKAFLAFDIMSAYGVTFMQALPVLEPFIPYSEDIQQIEVVIDLPPLVPDKYFISAWLGPHYTNTYDNLKEVISFDILDSPTEGRLFPHTNDHGMIVPSCSVRVNTQRNIIQE